MAFTSEEFAAWLLGLLTDGQRRRPTMSISGSDQERALRQAAAAAIGSTAAEFRPEGGERAAHLTMVIEQVFSVPISSRSLPDDATLLQTLQNSIYEQLVPLADLSLTGIGISSAELLDVPTATLADTLTGHLLREILLRGARGGPLTALSEQLKHDLQHAQSQQLDGSTDYLVETVSEWLTRIDGIRGSSDVTEPVPEKPNYQTILAIDINMYSKLTYRDQVKVQIIVHQLLEQVLAQIGIGPSDYELSDLGDSILVLLSADTTRVKSLTRLIPILATALDRYNQTEAFTSRIQMRIVVDRVLIFREAHGYVGNDLNHVLRLLDSALLRHHLAYTSADLALIVTDRLYSDVIEQDHPESNAKTFHLVHIALKGARVPAWIYMPERREEPVPSDPNELPAEVSNFSGREAELDHLKELLGRAGGSPTVVAVHGAGGVGKTALAIAAAHRLVPQFPDGQLYVNLHGATTGLPPVSLYDALSRLLDALGDDSHDVPVNLDEATARFRSLLADRRVLLVLDNAASAAQVRPLLPDNPSCAILVTSRQILTTLDSVSHFDLGVLPPKHAVLLLGRLAGIDRIGAEPLASEEVARQCGYLPLALRMAGACLAARPQLPVSTLTSILADEQTRLSELASENLFVRSAFQISYQALSGSDDDYDRTAARLFRLLGLHAGLDVSIWSAAALLDTSPPHAELALKRLADAQLLQRTNSERYRMHDLLMLFARTWNSDDEFETESDSGLRRLLDFYLTTAQSASLLLQSTSVGSGRGVIGSLTPPMFNSIEALAWFDAERTNLKAALEQAVAINASASVPEIAGHLFVYHKLRQQWADAALVQELALRAARQHVDRRAEARILNSLGFAYSMQGRFDDSLVFLEQGLAICREVGDRRGEGLGLTDLGMIYRERGDFTAAIACLQQGLLIAREVGDLPGEGRALANLGGAFGDQGLLVEAVTYYRSAIVIARRLGDSDVLGASLMGIGIASQAMGQLEESIECLEQSLTIYTENGHEHDRAEVCASLAAAYRLKGDNYQTGKYFQQGLEIARSCGDERGQVKALVGLGELYSHTNDFESAIRHLTQAVELAPDITNPRTEADAYSSLAEVYQHSSDLEASLYCRQRGLQIIQEAGDPKREAACLVALASTYMKLGRLEQAVSCYEYGLGVLRDLDDQPGEASALERLAEVHRTAGRITEATSCVRRSNVLRKLIRSRTYVSEPPRESPL